MPGFNTITRPRAAYWHTCWECQGRIQAGEQYVSHLHGSLAFGWSEFGEYEPIRTLSRGKYHPACWAAVEAESPDDAINKAQLRRSLCHQCASHIDIGDPYGFVVLDDTGAEVMNEADERDKRAAAEKAALLAEIERMHAERAEVVALLGCHPGMLFEELRQVIGQAELRPNADEHRQSLAEVERLTQERDASPAYLAWARERDRMRADLAASRAEVERLRQEWDEACGLLASESAASERLRAVLTALVDDSEGQQHRVAWQDACEALHGHRGPEAEARP